ncbi:MAG: DUF1624 domain-containing protein [Clostridia bacterium]|nr:DUF1624 domain-containing protein [Clostridia bacterium]
MELTAKTEQNKRYYLLDAVRGICILGMIFYHTLFDIVAFFGADVDATLMLVVDIIRDFGACCFICLSGMCIHFGRKPLKRALFILGASIIVSLVTFIFVPDMPIYFGILTFMGLAGLIMIPLKKVFDKLPATPFAVIAFILFLLTFEVSRGVLGYYSFEIAALPEFLYRNYFTALLGFPFYGFISSDYYPLIPWIFMFFFGFFLWKILSRSEKIMKILNFRISFLEKIGKWSLYIYIAHQPLIMGLLLLIFTVMNNV